MLCSIDRFDKFSFLTNQQQPYITCTKPGPTGPFTHCSEVMLVCHTFPFSQVSSIINPLLEGLVCSIVEYLLRKKLLVSCILTRATGSPKYGMTRKNIPGYYTLNSLIRYMYTCHPQDTTQSVSLVNIIISWKNPSTQT